MADTMIKIADAKEILNEVNKESAELMKKYPYSAHWLLSSYEQVGQLLIEKVSIGFMECLLSGEATPTTKTIEATEPEPEKEPKQRRTRKTNIVPEVVADIPEVPETTEVPEVVIDDFDIFSDDIPNVAKAELKQEVKIAKVKAPSAKAEDTKDLADDLDSLLDTLFD